MHAARWFTALLLAGCGHSARPAARPAEPPPAEHWQTVSERNFVYTADRCAVGPFEIVLPARPIEWGRRLVVQVYGPRGLQIEDSLDGTSRWQWGMAWPHGDEGDHSRCRATQGDQVVAAPAAPPSPGKPDKPGKPGKPEKPGAPSHDDRHATFSVNTPSDQLPKLVAFDGTITGTLQLTAANGWLPHGPFSEYADELGTAFLENDNGAEEMRLRFWFYAPSDLDGIVFRVLDQDLVPNLPADQYAREYPARSARAKAALTAYQPTARAETEKWAEHCKAHAEDARCIAYHKTAPQPPPPRTEVRPKAPGANVDWVPGYWSWSTEDNEFTWIDGTFVVRAPIQVATVTPPPAHVEVATEAPAPPPVEVAAQVEAMPAPRVEVIPPPPPTTGATWVAGHWELAGTSWRWIAGLWIVPPSATARYQAPTVRVRGGVRIYLPGRWRLRLP